MKPEVIISGQKKYIFICGFNIRSCSAFLERVILVRSKCTLQVYQPFGDCRLPAATLKEEFSSNWTST